jgi:hypothetical protein
MYLSVYPWKPIVNLMSNFFWRVCLSALLKPAACICPFHQTADMIKMSVRYEHSLWRTYPSGLHLPPPIRSAVDPHLSQLIIFDLKR